jgi:hypothetical protein
MKHATARTLLLTAAIAALGLAARAEKEPAKPKPARRGVFTLVNQTDWPIHGVYMSVAEEDQWGANLLKGKPLVKGATVKLDVDCDEMDVKLLDAKGRKCVSESMYLCARNSTWTVTPQEILNCRDFGR